jgi:hypothetical protein
MTEQQAIAGVKHALTQMRRAFPDAGVETKLWAPLVPQMSCDEKDRHVLALAVGAKATHLVTTNIRNFPVRSRPAGVAVVTADRFLRDQLDRAPEQVVEAVEGMSRGLKSPPQSPSKIAALFAGGQSAPGSVATSPECWPRAPEVVWRRASTSVGPGGAENVGWVRELPDRSTVGTSARAPVGRGAPTAGRMFVSAGQRGWDQCCGRREAGCTCCSGRSVLR